MSAMKIMGLRPYDFEDKSGKQIQGVSVHCAYEDERIVGVGVERFSISNDKLGKTKLELGMLIEPLYNKYGKVDGIRPL